MTRMSRRAMDNLVLKDLQSADELGSQLFAAGGEARKAFISLVAALLWLK